MAFSIFIKICIHATAAKDRQYFKLSTDALKGAWFTYSFKEAMRKDCSTSVDISVTQYLDIKSKLSFLHIYLIFFVFLMF